MATFEEADFLRIMNTHPLHQHPGAQVISAQAGRSEVTAEVRADLLNTHGILHGGVMYTLLDIAALSAVVATLPDGINATTHDLHISMMRPVPEGATIHLRGRVRRQGRTIAFIDSEAEVNGKLVASARVTKSLIPSG